MTLSFDTAEFATNCGLRREETVTVWGAERDGFVCGRDTRVDYLYCECPIKIPLPLPGRCPNPCSVPIPAY